jgi:hypothetical protein
MTSENVWLYDDELTAYREAHVGGGVSLSVTWVPFGMSVWQAVQAEDKALDDDRQHPADTQTTASPDRA